MRKSFFQRTFPLILAGVLLGLFGRWILGIDPNAETNRRFKRPIDSELLDADDTADIKLDESFSDTSD